MNDKDIANAVMDHFDPACYGLRCVLALSSPRHDILSTLSCQVFLQSAAAAESGA